MVVRVEQPAMSTAFTPPSNSQISTLDATSRSSNGVCRVCSRHALTAEEESKIRGRNCTRGYEQVGMVAQLG